MITNSPPTASSFTASTSKSGNGEGAISKSGKNEHQNLFSKLLASLQGGNQKQPTETEAKKGTSNAVRNEGKQTSINHLGVGQAANTKTKVGLSDHQETFFSKLSDKSIQSAKDDEAMIAVVQETPLLTQKPVNVVTEAVTKLITEKSLVAHGDQEQIPSLNKNTKSAEANVLSANANSKNQTQMPKVQSTQAQPVQNQAAQGIIAQSKNTPVELINNNPAEIPKVESSKGNPVKKPTTQNDSTPQKQHVAQIEQRSVVPPRASNSPISLLTTPASTITPTFAATAKASTQAVSMLEVDKSISTTQMSQHKITSSPLSSAVDSVSRDGNITSLKGDSIKAQSILTANQTEQTNNTKTIVDSSKQHQSNVKEKIVATNQAATHQPVVTMQQRPHPTSQEQMPSLLTQSNVTVKGSESFGTGTQQDFTSDDENINTSAFDFSKVDNKTKTADFHKHMSYQTQKSYSPSDAMLEIVKSAKDGKTSIELQLEPAHLGKVQVSIQMDAAKHIQVAFTVDQNHSRQLLEQHMPQLKMALVQQGLDLGSFSMQMNQQGNQQGQDSSGQASLHQNGSNVTTNNQDTTQHTRMGVNLAQSGRINILA